MTDPTWKCPICGLVNLPYGTNCAEWQTCENPPHLTGQWYTSGQKADSERTMSVGISQISDEKDGE